MKQTKQNKNNFWKTAALVTGIGAITAIPTFAEEIKSATDEQGKTTVITSEKIAEFEDNSNSLTAKSDSNILPQVKQADVNTDKELNYRTDHVQFTVGNTKGYQNGLVDVVYAAFGETLNKSADNDARIVQIIMFDPTKKEKDNPLTRNPDDILIVTPDYKLKSVKTGKIIENKDTEQYLTDLVVKAQCNQDKTMALIKSQYKINLCNKIFAEEKAAKASGFYNILGKVLTDDQKKQLQDGGIDIQSPQNGLYAWIDVINQTNGTAKITVLPTDRKSKAQAGVELSKEQLDVILASSDLYCSEGPAKTSPKKALSSNLRVNGGYALNHAESKIARYNGKGVQVGETLKTFNDHSAEANVEGRLLLPEGFFLDGEGNAVYVFNNKNFGGKAALMAGYALNAGSAKVGLAAGVSGLIQKTERETLANLGPAGKLIFIPAQGSELDLTYKGFLGKNQNRNEFSLGLNQDIETGIGSILAEADLSVSSRTTPQTTLYNGNVDLKGTLSITPNLGVYLGAGATKAFDGSKDLSIRTDLGLEYRL